MLPTTLDTLLKRLSWSFNVLLTGSYPAHDWLGRRIPYSSSSPPQFHSKLRGALVQIRGDWEFYKQAFHFPAWNTKINMCYLCRASNDHNELTFSDFSDDAGWRQTIWTHEKYMRHVRRSALAIPILLSYVHGLRLECVTVDVLHTIDLGITSRILGSLLVVLVLKRGVLGGSNIPEKLQMLQARLKAWYSRAQVTSKYRGKFTRDRLYDAAGFPQLSGKAAALRHMSRFVLELMSSFCDGSDHDKLMLSMIQLLVRFYEILDTNSMYFSREVIEEVAFIGDSVAKMYGILANTAYAQKVKLWKVTPKLHMWLHLTLWQVALWGNPRFWWTYPDEDLVGVMMEVASSVHPRTLAFSCLFKWLHIVFDKN